jgi:hypothetical protein
MTTERRRPTISAFDSREHAEQALGGMREAGFRDEEIGWAARHDEAPKGVEDKSDDVAGGATAGALTGAGLGALGAAAGMALIPGLGPFLAGGYLGTILITAGASAAAGGLIGGLAGMGVDEDEAKFYDEEFRAGRPVMTYTGDRHDEARDIFRKHGGYDYESRRAEMTEAPAAHHTGTGATTTTEYTTRTETRTERQ